MVKITEYSEFKQYVSAFASGNITLAVMHSRGGLGKTRTVKEMMKEKKYCYLSGHITPLALYKELYENRDELIVIDDVDALYGNKVAIALLKQLCETSPEKEIQYNSTSPFAQDIPKKFVTKSHVMLLVNDIPDTLGMRAFMTRGVYLQFEPSPYEVVKRLATVARSNNTIPFDKEVYNYFAEVAPVSRAPQFRAYLQAVSLKQSNIDWRKALDESIGVDIAFASVLRARSIGKNYQEQIKIFAALTGKSRRTYDRRLLEIKEAQGSNGQLPEVTDNDA